MSAKTCSLIIALTTFAGNFSRVWMVIACAALQTCATYLAFGGFGVVFCSKRGEYVSRLEGCGWFGAPNVGSLSRVWRVCGCVALQTCATFLAFGGFGLAFCSKRGVLFSRLEGYCLCCAPNVRNFSRVWRVWCGVLLQTCATYLAFGGFLSFYPQLIFFLLSHFFAR